MCLDLDLATQLVLDPGLAQLALVEHLEGDNEMRLLLAREVDLPKFAVAQRLADVEVAQRPLAKWLLLCVARVTLHTESDRTRISDAMRRCVVAEAAPQQHRLWDAAAISSALGFEARRAVWTVARSRTGRRSQAVAAAWQAGAERQSASSDRGVTYHLLLIDALVLRVHIADLQARERAGHVADGCHGCCGSLDDGLDLVSKEPTRCVRRPQLNPLYRSAVLAFWEGPLGYHSLVLGSMTVNACGAARIYGTGTGILHTDVGYHPPRPSSRRLREHTEGSVSWLTN